MTGSRKLSLDDLAALNDEIASLVRAGVPLELGLRGFGSEVGGRLAALTDRLSQRMSGGISLSDALAEEGADVPEIYRAVVRTGLEAGRLPEALESLTGFTQSVVDVRRRINLALLYPCVVALLAYGLFVGFLMFLVPRLEETYRSLRLPVRDWLHVLSAMSTSVGLWGPIIPVVFALALLWWFWASWQRPQVRIGGLMENFSRANFCELLALLVGHKVPLPEALVLAAEATGHRKITRAAHRISTDLKAGWSLADSLKASAVFPAFMQWMMITGDQRSSLAPALCQVTEVYRRRAVKQCEWFKLVFPIVLIVGIGGSATLVYALTLFYPLSALLRDLNVG